MKANYCCIYVAVNKNIDYENLQKIQVITTESGFKNPNSFSEAKGCYSDRTRRRRTQSYGHNLSVICLAADRQAAA